MNIRPYCAADKERLLEILRENIPQYFAVNEEQDFIDYLNHHLEQYYVLEVEGIIQACGGINLGKDGITAVISWDVVARQSQGKGYGRALTTFRIERMKEMEGISRVSVRTSQLVYQFYEKFGLQLREVVKDYWSEGFDLYRLDCRLDQTTL